MIIGRDGRRLLEALSGGSLTMAQLRERGVQRPGEAIYELQLSGIAVEREHRSGAATYRLVDDVRDVLEGERA